VSCIVLQCGALCCIVLQCVATCCSVLHCVAVRWSKLQCIHCQIPNMFRPTKKDPFDALLRGSIANRRCNSKRHTFAKEPYQNRSLLQKYPPNRPIWLPPRGSIANRHCKLERGSEFVSLQKNPTKLNLFCKSTLQRDLFDVPPRGSIANRRCDSERGSEFVSLQIEGRIPSICTFSSTTVWKADACIRINIYVCKYAYTCMDLRVYIYVHVYWIHVYLSM